MKNVLIVKPVSTHHVHGISFMSIKFKQFFRQRAHIVNLRLQNKLEEMSNDTVIFSKLYLYHA